MTRRLISIALCSPSSTVVHKHSAGATCHQEKVQAAFTLKTGLSFLLEQLDVVQWEKASEASETSEASEASGATGSNEMWSFIFSLKLLSACTGSFLIQS